MEFLKTFSSIMEEQKVKLILNNTPLLSSLVYIQIFSFFLSFLTPPFFAFFLFLSFLPLSLPPSSFLSTLFSFFILSIITAFIFIVVP